MRRRLIVPIAIALVPFIVACGDSDSGSVSPDTTELPTESTPAEPAPTTTSTTTAPPPTAAPHVPSGTMLARYRMPGGECDRCDFDLAFRADATVVLRSWRGELVADYEVEVLQALLDGFDSSAFVIGATDCGREVDGNAAIVVVAGDEIDLCYAEVRPDDPLIGFLETERARVEAMRDERSEQPQLVARVSDVGGLCPNDGCGARWRFWTDGLWTLDDGLDVTAGSYDADALLAALPSLAAASPDLGEFTGTCPTADDGRERIYQVYEDGSLLWGARSCNTEIDTAHPLIVALDAAVTGTR